MRTSGDIQPLTQHRAVCNTFPCRGHVVGVERWDREEAVRDLHRHIASDHTSLVRSVLQRWRRVRPGAGEPR